MRQFLSWRYWAALGVLFAMTAVLWACQGGSSPAEVVINANSRRIDLIAQTSTIRSDGTWSVSGGVTRGDATAVLQDGRVLTLADGNLA